MGIYLILLGAVVVLGRWMPQQGPNRKYYIVLMALLHTLVCGLRHPHLTGDLMKYHWQFNAAGAGTMLPEGKNLGFFLLMRTVCRLTDGDFQIFLFLIAAVSQMAAALVIWRCSPAPWLSYLTLQCFGFYLFGFSAIKQGLGMALILLAFLGIVQNRPRWFLLFTLLAGAVHLPMLAFLPAYLLTRFRINRAMLVAYALLAAVLYAFRQQVAEFAGGVYYGGETAFSWSRGLGGRFFLILLMTAAGILLRGVEDREFNKLLHLMAISAVLQMFSGFDNVFTRLADVYFQFSVVFIPQMLCLPGKGSLAFSRDSRKWLGVLAAVFLIWFYWQTNLRVEIGNPVDNYLNFQFFWQDR